MPIEPRGIGKRIRSLRQSRGLMQHELAEHLNISVTHICKLEGGKSIPSLDLCLEIGEYFGVSVDFILTGRNHGDESTYELIQKTIYALSEIGSCLCKEEAKP